MISESNMGVRILIGLFLVWMGVSFLLRQFGFDYSLFGFWPIILIALGGYMFLTKKSFAGVLIVFLGLVFLGGNFLKISVFTLLWPMLLIFAGVIMLVRPQQFGRFNDSGSTTEDDITATAFFGGYNKKVLSKAFKGGHITALFGGVEIDLRDAKLADKAEIIIDTLFGGTEIIVPQGMNVISEGTALFGAWENSSLVAEKPTGTIKITGSVLFGGVEIKTK